MTYDIPWRYPEHLDIVEPEIHAPQLLLEKFTGAGSALVSGKLVMILPSSSMVYTINFLRQGHDGVHFKIQLFERLFDTDRFKHIIHVQQDNGLQCRCQRGDSGDTRFQLKHF